jgi:protein-tyrosine kinase
VTYVSINNLRRLQLLLASEQIPLEMIMSKNFELLQRAGRERDIFETAPITQINPGVPRLALSVPARTQVEKLVQQLFLNSNGLGPRMVVFTSTDANDRCSLICAHAGDTLATRIAGSVCVVDANLHSPSLHQHFKRDNQSGLAELIQHPEKPLLEVAEPVFEGNLSLLSAGSTEQDREELLRSADLKLRMGELRQQFSHVLIAAPPVHQHLDALILGQFADGIVLIVKANSTRRNAAREVREQIAASRIQVLGVVLDDRRFPIPEVIYSRL